MTAASVNGIPTHEVVLQSLIEHGLCNVGEAVEFEPLAGGVSSDIWKLTAGDRIFCVKRALAKLKVEVDWFAPVERNRYEVAWYQFANKHVPGSAPRILVHDENAMLFAMEYLDPQTHKLWKNELRDGHADTEQARLSGQRLGRIHAKTAKDSSITKHFPPTGIFHAIRLEPYLEATAAKHTDLRDPLFALSQKTAQTRLSMIHGDVSPKNILLGPSGPVFLDAECACIGDPAFDIAFCLNHFLLKCIWTPAATSGFMSCFEEMTLSYLNEVDWEQPDTLEARAASLLPGLFLARVDGKSPVEYIKDEKDKEKIRHCARSLLFTPPKRLSDVANAWNEELSN